MHANTYYVVCDSVARNNIPILCEYVFFRVLSCRAFVVVIPSIKTVSSSLGNNNPNIMAIGDAKN